MPTDKISIIRLYRNILKNALLFPSIKKHKILLEIKTGFHANKSLTDEKKINQAVKIAINGLSQLSMYSKLPRDQVAWEVFLEKDPMPNSKQA